MGRKRIRPRNESIEEMYERWWLGKWVRHPTKKGPFRKVIRVEWIGPPSGVYGGVTLHFEEGPYWNVPAGDGFRPRKYHVEVRSEKDGSA